MNEIGVADPLNYGVGIDPYKGTVAPWRQWIDYIEYVPELRWPRSIWVYDQMRTDSQLAALITAQMWGITQLRFLLDANGARPSLVKELSEDLNIPIKGEDAEPLGRMKKRFSHHKFSTQAMLAVIYGHMYFEQLGEIVDEKWRLRKLAPRMPQTIQQINVSNDGSLVSLRQWQGNTALSSNFQQGGIYAPEIPVDRLTGFIFQQEGYSWVGRSMMRDCYKDWLIKDRLLRVEAINHERAGGVPYANAPQGATPAEIEDLDQMMRQFRIGESAGGALPFGADLKIARGSGSDIDKSIHRYNEAMARRFMMMVANLAQGGQHVGSYGMADAFNDLWHISQRAIAQWYCDTVNEHIIEDIVDWNYGEDEEFVPKLTWERTSEDSLGTDQLALLVQRGVIIVDEEVENAIRYKYQLPKRTAPRPLELMGPGLPRNQPIEAPPGTPPGPGTVSQATIVPSPSGAPSSGDGTTHASFWRKLTGRSSPDVQATTRENPPCLVTVPNVEILHAGIEYNLSTGPTTFTPEDLMDVVMAANEDGSIPNPRLKIGHIDPRFNDTAIYDGSPAFGKATNLRLSDNGTSVYADYVGVPKWLADIMPAAFPSRSIEGYWNVESQMGKKWRFVLSACSVLGVTWPGVTVLEDLPQYYGAELPDDVVVDPALISATGGDPGVKIPFRKSESTASANLDDVRRAFYNDWMHDHPEANWWWVQAVLTDPNELVVEDDETGQLYKIPFSSDDNSLVSFGDAAAVRIDYIPDDRESQKAAASHIAATLAVGRKVIASYPDRAASRPDTTGGAMDPKEVRKRLGLPEDASDEQVREALKELNTLAGVTEVEPPAPAAAPAAAPPAPAAVVEPSAEPVVEPQSQPIAASALPPGTVLVDGEQWKATVAASQEASEFVQRQKERDREGLVSAAIKDGRIAPASKEHWSKLLATDPNAAETLAGLAKGLIPVEARGHGGTGTEGEPDALSPDVVQGWTAQLFPETRQQVSASGEPLPRNRITADASYRR